METRKQPDRAPPVRQGVFRRTILRANTAVALALAATLGLMFNYLSYRHYGRLDWSRGRYFTLSEKTRSLLAGLTGSVDVVVFLQPHQELFEDVHQLLREYEYASPQIHVERVDPDRDLARTEELMRRYEVSEPNVIVFDSGGRRKYVRAAEIAEYDYTALQYGRSPERVAFKGEQAFSSAIYSITQIRKPTVYFLQGHGERDIESFERGLGYAAIAEFIRRDHAEVKPLVLGPNPVVPDDASALVVAGPQKALAPAELDVLRDYLERQGRLLLLLDAATTTGLEPLLEKWGVRIGDDVVLDATRTLTGRELFITEYEPHPITRRLNGLSTVLYLPRSVEPLDGEPVGEPVDRPAVTALALCSESGWAETDRLENPMRYDPERDRPGPVPVAVAVEKGPLPGIDVQIRPTRLVIIGDSDFVANGVMTGANADFFLSALNWLLEREELMAIAAKPVEDNRLIMTATQLRTLFWIVMAGLPALPALLGTLVWWRRRT
ncbi:MAG: GldG family protein [Verrucomicrobia bacterium]|nr:GldG family protein [Verrucomicrobiota bacterium]MBU1909710.1 GldG family protein [Verrucomicrobiota bacterium]